MFIAFRLTRTYAIREMTQAFLSVSLALIPVRGIAAVDRTTETGSRTPLNGVCVFSRDAMFATATISKASNERLQQLRDESQTEANLDRDLLQADTRAVEDGQAGVSPVLMRQLRDRLADRASALDQKIVLRTRELEQTRRQVTSQIETAAAPIIREIKHANNCKLLLTRESVIDSPDIVDITQAVITQMNMRLQPVAFQRLKLQGPTGGR